MNCHPTHCGLLVDVADERVVGVRGDPEHPESRGFTCMRGQAAPSIVDNAERVLEPLARGADGSFHVSSWEEALDTIAAAIREVGTLKTAVYTGHGVRNQLSARFARMLGAQWWDPSIVCWGLGGFGFHVTGVTEVNTAEDLAQHAELIVLWGSNLVSQPTTFPRLLEAKRRGAQVLAIDVRHTESFGLADATYLVRPGSDTALALGMLHVIVAERLYDEEFVREHCVGFDALKEHIAQYDPTWAAGETGLRAEEVVALARRYASSKRSMILAGASSMHKTGNGYHAARAISCLPALTGSLGHAGAGMGPRHAGKSHGFGVNSILPADVKHADDVVPPEMSRILEALETGKVEVLLLLGTNFLSSFADGARAARALSKLRLVVCFDLFESDTSRESAHLLLPGTSWLEEVGFKVTNTHLYLTDALLAPRGNAKSSAWLLEQLALRLGRPDFYPWSSFEEVLNEVFDHPALARASVQKLRDSGGAQRLAVDSVGHASLRFATPSGKVELWSERARELGLSPLPEPPPPGETARGSSLARRFPLVFVQGRSLTHFHSFYDHGRGLPTLQRADPEPTLWLSVADAATRGVTDGDAIRIRNERGEMRAKAHVTERVPSGVVWMHDGWRGINQLTSSARQVSDQIAKSFPAGSASYEARVQVELEAQ
jgi:anaerobic selenocysteine-containing dehydrogenase